MDFPVEATVHVNHFRDEAEVLRLLRSRGFELTDQGGGQVRVKGYFLKLKDVRERLEMAPRSYSPVPTASRLTSYYSENSSEGGAESSMEPPPSSPYGRPDSQDDRGLQVSQRSGGQSVVVDTDVFRYASQFRKQELDAILKTHGRDVKETGGSTSITLSGKTSTAAVTKLQILLDDLNQTLRTQEVPLKDLSREGSALLSRIKKSKDISGPVQVRVMEDTLHLVGPSKESYELKQTLLGRPVNQSAPRGRPVGKSSRERSSSVPANTRSSGRKGGAVVAGAAGSSSWKDDGQRGASALDPSGAQTKRSLPEFAERKEKMNADEKDNKLPTPKQGWNLFQCFGLKRRNR